MDLKALVREIPDFPIPGILFRDISPILQSPQAFHFALESLAGEFDLNEIDHFIGVESRGFILGAALAAKFNKGFVPLRKAGKLPPPVESISYDLEYGSASLEVRAGTGRALVIDDVLATGGTLSAAIELSERAGYKVVSAAVLIDLKSLNQFRFRGEPVHSVLSY